MPTFNTKIYPDDGVVHTFECYENTEPIQVGDYYIYFMWGGASVMKCSTETEKHEINPNDIVCTGVLDLVTGFWKQCYKIKTTTLDLATVD